MDWPTLGVFVVVVVVITIWPYATDVSQNCCWDMTSLPGDGVIFPCFP
jgi:hypothetical protein